MNLCLSYKNLNTSFKKNILGFLFIYSKKKKDLQDYRVLLTAKAPQRKHYWVLKQMIDLQRDLLIYGDKEFTFSMK